jgi:hypothetical protein
MLQTLPELMEFCQNLIDKGVAIPDNLELTAYVSREEYDLIKKQTGMSDYKHGVLDKYGNIICIELEVIN